MTNVPRSRMPKPEIATAGSSPAVAVGAAEPPALTAFVALADALYDLAHANAGVGLVVGADLVALAIIVVYVGVPAAVLAVLASALRRRARLF
jgi:hypothetical protein